MLFYVLINIAIILLPNISIFHFYTYTVHKPIIYPIFICFLDEKQFQTDPQQL